ncbi:Uncharacterised protein [Vibrio cholerae]|nr:Uncharacterised protein [Vibrio cholerae]CSC90371.1 Uncharacterised protein [Vibrio cholerae]CSD14883.1 Uncharacterised protein [Vibrio cholerae]CSD21589.1 Uncharacterised protein [Vibrio cholerae]CSD77929.1 Uncharacterised protein [Vibrio cholerae]
MFARFMDKAVHQAFFSGEAVQKVDIAFAVLHTKLTLHAITFERKSVIVDAHLLQQDRENLRDSLLLENAAVMTQG